MLCVDQRIVLRAVPSPGGSFPAGYPRWAITAKPDASQLANPDPPDAGETLPFGADRPGLYTLTATCGSSSASIDIVARICEPDIDLDSNNDGSIALTNLDSEDVYEAQAPGLVLPIGHFTDIRIEAPFEEGVLTLTSTFGEALSLGTTTTTWDLGNGETPPESLTLSPVTGTSPYSPLNLNEPSRSGSLTLTYTAPDHTVKTDTVALTIVRPVSKCPQNNRAVLFQPVLDVRNTANELGRSELIALGYQWKQYVTHDPNLVGDLADGEYRPTYDEIKSFGSQGVFLLESHGNAEKGTLAHVAIPREEALTFFGVDNEDQLLNLGVHIIPHTFIVHGEETQGAFAAISPAWMAANWSSGKSSRSIHFYLACHSYFWGSFGRASYGYTNATLTSDHKHDMSLMLSRLAPPEGVSRPTGIAYENGGFTDRLRIHPDNEEEPLVVVRFVEISDTEYWTTISPAAFAYADSSGESASENLVGTTGVYLDTERDNAVPPEDIILTTSGPSPTRGPYSVSPAWGVATEFLLHPGQAITQTLDNTKIWGDGSTHQLILPSGATWSNSN